MTDLEKVIRPIVEGQLKTFGHAHPAVVEAVDWRYSQPTKLDAFVASAAKRIITALLADQTVDRLRSALEVGKRET